MHPQLAGQLAIQHVNDMRAEAAVARRARLARRARRGAILMSTPILALATGPDWRSAELPATELPVTRLRVGRVPATANAA
jgi:hypothetical protein